MPPDKENLIKEAVAKITVLLEHDPARAKSLIDNIDKLEGSFRKAHEGAIKFEKGMNAISSIFRSTSGVLNSFGSFFNAANLSLKSGAELAYKYNQAVVSTFSQFQKYNISLKDYKSNIDNIRSTYKTTYDEAIKLSAGFEKSFNVLGPEKMDSVLNSIAKTVGKDASSMESFLQGITAITGQNPALEKMLENVQGNAKAIEDYVDGLMASGQIGMSQYKQFLEMTSAKNRQPEDRTGFNEMQDKNLAFRQVQNIYETAAKDAGDKVLSVNKAIVDSVGEWSSGLSKVLEAYIGIQAVLSNLGGMTSGIFNILDNLAALKILGAGKVVGGAASVAGGVGRAALGLGAGTLGVGALAAGSVAFAGYEGIKYARHDYTTQEGIDAAGKGAYTKNGSSYVQFAGDSNAKAKMEAYKARHPEAEKVSVAEKKITSELGKQEQSKLKLVQEGYTIQKDLERQKTLIESSNQLLSAQALFYGQAGSGSVGGNLKKVREQLDQQEATYKAKLANLQARGGLDDPLKLKEYQDTQREILNIQKQRVEITETFVKENQSQIEQQERLVSLSESQISLQDSAGMGLRAQVGARKMLMDQLSKEISLIGIQVSKSEEQMAVLQEQKKATTDPEKLRDIEYQIYTQNKLLLENRTKQTQTMQKQAEVSKSMREGWISAISAMTTGAGVFTRIVISQEKNLGNLTFAQPDKIKALRMGGTTGGRTSSAQWTPGGFREGSAGGFEKDVLSQYGVNPYNTIQQTVNAMMEYQEKKGSKMSPAAATFGVGPQGTGEVTSQIKDGVKNFMDELVKAVSSIGPAISDQTIKKIKEK